jgi:hypothetical protein
MSVASKRRRDAMRSMKGEVKLAYKPGSVQGLTPWAIIPLDHRLPDGSSGLPGSSASHALAPLFGLAPDGVWHAAPVTRSAVGSYPQHARRRAAAHLAVARTISSLPEPSARCWCKGRPSHQRGNEPSAVYFLFHFPSPRGARPLAGIPLCGARTFLCTRQARTATARPASLKHRT